MQMTIEEYNELIAHFEFLEDKVEECYKHETEQVLENIKEEYKQYVIS